MSTKIWNLCYVPGNPKLFSREVKDSSGPFARRDALEAAERIASNGWRVWVEHSGTRKRIFESEAEKEHQYAS